MSRILLAWELGTGFGHLGPFLSLAPALLARGHTLHIAAREVAAAVRAVGELPIRVHQAPLCLNTYGELQEPPLNYAEILMRYGYLDSAMLRGLLAAWRSLLSATGADLVIADHAPTALLAARGLPVGRAAIGSSFYVPPAVMPTPNMRSWVAVPMQRLADSDRRVLEVINHVLPPDERLDALHHVFDRAARFFLGVPELDPYDARPESDYLGLQAQSTGTSVPEWPEAEAPRIFAYLNPAYRHVDRALRTLADCNASVLAHIFGGNAIWKQRYGSAKLKFSPDPVDMHRVIVECDLCVCNGNVGTTLGMLGGGRPVLVLPMQLEHFLLGKALERIGVGSVVHPDAAEPDITATLGAMLTSATFGAQARAFALKHREPSIDTIKERAIGRIEALAQTQGYRG